MKNMINNKKLFFMLIVMSVNILISQDIVGKWDLDVERKRRIWKPFWTKLFESNEELNEGVGPVPSASKRLQEQLDKLSRVWQHCR